METLPGQHIKNMGVFSCVTNRALVLHDGPADFGVKYGTGPEYGMFGVQRETFHKALVDAALARGIPIHFGYHLEKIVQSQGEGGKPPCVQMSFANGESVEASFIIGCDGLHSNTRSELFGEMKPDYTGLVQVCVLSLLTIQLTDSS